MESRGQCYTYTEIWKHFFLSLFDPVLIKGGIAGLGRWAALWKLSFSRLREMAETTIVTKTENGPVASHLWSERLAPQIRQGWQGNPVVIIAQAEQTKVNQIAPAHLLPWWVLRGWGVGCSRGSLGSFGCFEAVSLCSPVCLELLPQPPDSWNYSHEPLWPAACGADGSPAHVGLGECQDHAHCILPRQAQLLHSC